MQPEIAATDHGLPMSGIQLRNALTGLAENFREMAVPKAGRYVIESAKADEKGIKHVPKLYVGKGYIATLAILSALAAFTVVRQLDKRHKYFV